MKQQGWTEEATRRVTFFTGDTFRKFIGALHTTGLEKLRTLVKLEGYNFVGIDTFDHAFQEWESLTIRKRQPMYYHHCKI